MSVSPFSSVQVAALAPALASAPEPIPAAIPALPSAAAPVAAVHSAPAMAYGAAASGDHAMLREQAEQLRLEVIWMERGGERRERLRGRHESLSW